MVFARAESLGKGRNMIMSKDEYLITDEPLKALTIFAMPMILGSFFSKCIIWLIPSLLVSLSVPLHLQLSVPVLH